MRRDLRSNKVCLGSEIVGAGRDLTSSDPICAGSALMGISGSQLGMDRRTGWLSTGKRVSLFDIFCIAEASVCVWIGTSMSFCVIVLTWLFAGI